MAQAGDIIESSRTKVLFRQTAADTNGELLQFDQWVQPGSPAPAYHMHPRQTERFVVVAGTMGVRTNGQERMLEAGQEIVVRAGVPHTFWNAGAGVLHQSIELRPALRSETFFETVVGFENDGTLPLHGTPNLLKLALILPTYEVFLPAPIWVQKLGFGVLGLVGRVLGYRTFYPKFSKHGLASAHTHDVG